MDENTMENTIMQMDGDIEANVVTQRVILKLAKGGAAQMAKGYSGVAKGMAGGGVQRHFHRLMVRVRTAPRFQSGLRILRLFCYLLQ